MRTITRIAYSALAAAALGSISAKAAISVAFDAVDSNIGAGLYDFTLSGAPSTAAFANFNSTFTLTGWAAPTIGNTASLVSTLAPSAWNVTENDSNNAKWILESYTAPNNLVDGRFQVQGSPNLHGTLTWQLAWLGSSGSSGSGSVTIAAVPESPGYAGLTASALLGLVAWSARKGFKLPADAH